MRFARDRHPNPFLLPLMGESNRSGRKNAFRKETASHDEPTGIHRRRSGGGAHLYRVAKAMVGNEEDCADAAQQAILRAWERLDTLRQPQYFRTWLTRILINECKGILRQRGRQAPYDQAAAEAIPAPAEEDHSDLYAALGALEEKYRLPVVMYYWEGFKTREIASLLRLPEGTVKSRLRTARIQLRDTLKGACFA